MAIIRNLAIAAVFMTIGANTNKEPPVNIIFESSAPEGLVGNGRSVVKVQPYGFKFFSGGDASGHFYLRIAEKRYDLKGKPATADFFPGGVIYSLKVSGFELDILHGALRDVPYLTAFRLRGKKNQEVEIEIAAKGLPEIKPTGRNHLNFSHGNGQLIFSSGKKLLDIDWENLKSRIEEPYKKGLILHSPSQAINRTVRFSQFLLDLGYDGKLMVSEMFRWRDIWSRDLGSGLVPGALAGGRVKAAKTCIIYELNRYKKANPKGLKITEDASQGGSAEGTAWLTKALWQYYLSTGDVSLLKEAEQILYPWVEAWIDRDYDKDGLVIDVTEWMDHSRFFLLPDGAYTLYSNVLLVDLFNTFSKIEKELDNISAAERLEALGKFSARAINTRLWNEKSGAYDNLILWGKQDERLASAANSLAILSGVASTEHAQRILTALRKFNWQPAGSVTIQPPMTHVDRNNDQNVRVWPWWNAVEALARFKTNDAEGAVCLLEHCANTLKDKKYPGLIEELLTPNGVSEGGNAFVSAAGSFLNAVVQGLLGVEIIEPGCKRIRVIPNTPPDWTSFEARVPLSQGNLEISFDKGKLNISVTDLRVKFIEAPKNTVVTGAKWLPITKAPAQSMQQYKKVTPLKAPPVVKRTAALFYEEGIPYAELNYLPKRRVNAEKLLNINVSDISALIIAGNALPLKTKSGGDIRKALEQYLNKGGSLVFYGATMHDRGTMGEHGGVIEWYEYLPIIRYEILKTWRFKPSPDGKNTPLEREHGYINGWHKLDVDKKDWKPIKVPGWWEGHLHRPHDGWGWYSTEFYLNPSLRGKAIVLELGRIDDDDSTYVNGIPVGSNKGWQNPRFYHIKPGTKAYEKLNFEGKNLITVQVLDCGGGGGMHADSPKIGFETDSRAWQPVNPTTNIAAKKPVRHGVVSWGPGNFFNSWETSRGVFGFKINGKGVTFNSSSALAGLSPLKINVKEAFTNFAVSQPWRFETLAFTETHRGILHPDNGERYPCAARVVNSSTKGEFVLIPVSLTNAGVGPKILKQLKIN